MPDTWLAMLISLARRKPRVLGAEPGEEGATCSWKTVLWAWSASAARGQGPETRGKEALPSPAPGTPEQGCPVCARAGVGQSGSCARHGQHPPAAEESGASEHNWQTGWALACRGLLLRVERAGLRAEAERREGWGRIGQTDQYRHSGQGGKAARLMPHPGHPSSLLV